MHACACGCMCVGETGKLETQGRVEVSDESKVSLETEFLLWGVSVFFLLWPSTDWSTQTIGGESA